MLAVPTPAANFEGWYAKLLTSIAPNDTYYQLLPSFDELVDQIFTNSILASPLERHTEFFLTRLVKEILVEILDLRGLLPEEQVTVLPCLISTTRLVPWAAAHGRFDVVSSVLPLLEPSSML
jgi:hypothetical protein